PELYQANYSLAKASELIAEFEQIFFQNAGEIIENCIKHLDEEYGKFLIIEDIELLKIEKYYWVDVDELNLFKGITIK
ncbi:MAG: hypothetical protein HQ521_12255, partial [Bacteroidetes bacterium]|nr:hypothetical protein [Bacteroidota bacterium]